mmetsp:Transcript_20972/g.49668  ORF Transcript_20972/g.49668 Transcript_20972/m.49668 type:complete len:236 (+) Transcript_20972:214-921(+)
MVALRLYLCNLDLASPTAHRTLEVVHLCLLLNVVQHLRHVGLRLSIAPHLAVRTRRMLLLLLHPRYFLADLGQRLLALTCLALEPLRLSGQVVQLVLQRIEHLHCVARGELQPQQLVVALFDLLKVLLIFDLELIKVDYVKDLTHVLLLLQLPLHLLDLALERHILEPQLLRHRALCTQLLLHIPHSLLRNSLACAEILRACHNVPLELVRVLLDLRDPHVCLLHRRAERVEELL